MPFRPGHCTLRAALIASTALAVAPIVQAEDDILEPFQVAELREDTVTVYGTTNPIAVFDYPGQVSVFDRTDIETLAPSAISDVLRDVPGLDFSGGPRRTGEVPSIRGLSGQNVLVLLDGARQSFSSAHDGRFFIDPELIGRAEVVRGPASSLYGSGAVGGVLAFETVDAADLLSEGETWGARVRLGYQSVNKETLASVTGFTQQGKFDGVASFGIRRSSDIALSSGVDLPSNDEIGTALLKGSFAVTNALSVEGSWQRFNNEAVEPNNGQGTNGLGTGTLDQDVDKDISTDTYRLGLSFNPAQNALIDLNLVAYQSTSTVDERDPTIPRFISRDIDTTGVSGRNAARFDFGAIEAVLTIGGDWYKDEQAGSDDQTDDGLRGGVPNGESEFTGLFAQIETTLNTPAGELLIIPGIRYDEFESSSSIAPGVENSDDAVSPRIALGFTPSGVEWFRAFGSYSEGFRAPSINELYLDGVHFELPHPVLFNPMMGQFVFVNNNFIPNPNLVPEKTETFEVGAGFDFANVLTKDDRLQAKLSYFETDADDLINLSVDAAFDPTCFIGPSFFPCSGGTSESANVAKAELDGWEGELRYDSDDWFLGLTYSAVDGVDTETGEDLGSLTPDRLALNFGFDLEEYNTELGVRIQYADSFERVERNEMDMLEAVESRGSYTVLDVYASWRPAFNERLRFDLGVDNVFDVEYERVQEGVFEPGQNLKIAASYQFGG